MMMGEKIIPPLLCLCLQTYLDSVFILILFLFHYKENATIIS